MLGDPELKRLKKGDIIQLQRRGFFKVDQAYQLASEFSGAETPIVLFAIPDGHVAAVPTANVPKKETVGEVSSMVFLFPFFNMHLFICFRWTREIV